MKLIEVGLSKIIIHEKRQDQMIILKEKSGERQFPIVIGLMEASSIKMKFSSIKMPRPLTHDLVLSVVENLGAKIESLIIDKIVKHTFHAKLVIKTAQGEIRKVDARPSDGVAIAVRAKAPVFVEESVLASAQLPKV
jgi:uncharacterized protein